jgi:hypothetical protein
MSGQRQPGPVGGNAQVEDIDAGTSARISTPAPALAQTAARSQSSSAGPVTSDVPMSGGVLYAIGQASVVRIPVPGTNGLCIELNPKGWVPSGGSTSTLFFQDATGKRNLRLDYGYNVKDQDHRLPLESERHIRGVRHRGSHTGRSGGSGPSCQCGPRQFAVNVERGQHARAKECELDIGSAGANSCDPDAEGQFPTS